MNVVTSLRADEDIGPYQLLRPQLCDITNGFPKNDITRDWSSPLLSSGITENADGVGRNG